MSQQLTENTLTNLDVIAGILLRCFIITVGAMLFTWFVFLLFGEQVYCIQSRMVEITRKEFDLFMLYVMTFMKGLNLIFFLFPFLAIKWYLRGRR